jgi:serine/threonine-protein kinase HipA
MAELNVWMNGSLVGVWFALRTGTPGFRYEARWRDSPEGRVLSLSLPFTASLEHRGEVVTNYFDNLLPESVDIRRRLRARFSARSIDAFDLLTAIGRDCVGAVQLLPPDTAPQGWNRVECEPLTEAGVAQVLASATSASPLGPDEQQDFRISIAGAQEKTALLKMGTRWYRPRGATPTTHILKLPLGLVGNLRADMTDSVENEWLCAQLMSRLGIQMADTEMARFGHRKVLVVKRFDRRWQGIDEAAEERAAFKPPARAWIARLPQEDLCQALGVAPSRKYQPDGGPSMSDCLRVLAESEQAAADRGVFVLAQFAFWLLAATDGHAKNFSIYHRRAGRFGLTRLYDVISAWPIIGTGLNKLPYDRAKLAMGVPDSSVHYRLRDIRPRHWKGLADRCGPGVWDRIVAMAESVQAVLPRVQALLPERFPPRVWTPISSGVRRHAQRFLRAANSP